MMHKGNLSAKADLINLKKSEHFYALDFIENLKGEIQIFDSKPFNTKVIDNTICFDYTFRKKALLVHASVSTKKSIPIPVEVITYEQL